MWQNAKSEIVKSRSEEMSLPENQDKAEFLITRMYICLKFNEKNLLT